MEIILIDLTDFDLQEFLNYKNEILARKFDGFILVRAHGTIIPPELSKVLMDDAANGRGTVFACDRMRNHSLLEANAEDATTLKEFLVKFNAKFTKIQTVIDDCKTNK